MVCVHRFRAPSPWLSAFRSERTLRISDLQKSRHLQRSHVTERHNRGTHYGIFPKIGQNGRPGGQEPPRSIGCLLFVICLQMTRLLQVTSNGRSCWVLACRSNDGIAPRPPRCARGAHNKRSWFCFCNKEQKKVTTSDLQNAS